MFKILLSNNTVKVTVNMAAEAHLKHYCTDLLNLQVCPESLSGRLGHPGAKGGRGGGGGRARVRVHRDDRCSGQGGGGHVGGRSGNKHP